MTFVTKKRKCLTCGRIGIPKPVVVDGNRQCRDCGRYKQYTKTISKKHKEKLVSDINQGLLIAEGYGESGRHLVTFTPIRQSAAKYIINLIKEDLGEE